MSAPRRAEAPVVALVAAFGCAGPQNQYQAMLGDTPDPQRENPDRGPSARKKPGTIEVGA